MGVRKRERSPSSLRWDRQRFVIQVGADPLPHVDQITAVGKINIVAVGDALKRIVEPFVCVVHGHPLVQYIGLGHQAEWQEKEYVDC